MHREGSCACGAIRFELTAEPIGTGACHCTTCQKLSGGGPNFVALLPKGSVKVTQGTPRIFAGTGDSGGKVERAFCADCGTPLWSLPEHAPFMTLKVGALDRSDDMAPAMHIYTASAPKWHHLPTDVPNFSKMPQ